MQGPTSILITKMYVLFVHFLKINDVVNNITVKSYKTILNTDLVQKRYPEIIE